MKAGTAVLMLLVLGGGLQAGYKIGHHAGHAAAWREARSWAASEAAASSEIQIHLFRQAQGLREESQYWKGKEACR